MSIDPWRVGDVDASSSARVIGCSAGHRPLPLAHALDRTGAHGVVDGRQGRVVLGVEGVQLGAHGCRRTGRRARRAHHGSGGRHRPRAGVPVGHAGAAPAPAAPARAGPEGRQPLAYAGRASRLCEPCAASAPARAPRRGRRFSSYASSSSSSSPHGASELIELRNRQEESTYFSGQGPTHCTSDSRSDAGQPMPQAPADAPAAPAGPNPEGRREGLARTKPGVERAPGRIGRRACDPAGEGRAAVLAGQREGRRASRSCYQLTGVTDSSAR